MKEKINNFFKKYGVVFLLLIPIFFSIVFRMYPATLPVADDWAANQVDSFYKNQVAQQVSIKYPNLPQEQFNNLVDTEYNKYIKDNKDLIEQQTKDSAENLRSKFQDNNGNTYLLAIDPWSFYRQTRNLVETGHHYDTLKDGKPWNTHIIAPIGKPMQYRPDAHVLFQYYMHKVVSFFNRDVSLMAVIFYMPILISMLSVIPAFFITRRIAGNVGGLVASIIVAVHPVFLGRTPGGFADTDAYNVFFPLYILWFCVLAFYTKKVEWKIIWAVICSFMIGLYAVFWTNWLIFDILLGSIVLYLLYMGLQNFKQYKKIVINKYVKNTLIIFGVLLLMSPIFTYLFAQQNLLSISISSPLRIAGSFKSVSHANYWPNVYTTVAELNEVNYEQVIKQIGFSSTGSTLFFFMAIFGIGFALINRKNSWLAILLTVWFVGTMYGSTKGVRFLLLLVPAFSVAFGVFIGLNYTYLKKLFEKHLSVQQNVSSVVLLGLIGLILFIPISQASIIAKQEIPAMNDAWYNTLIEIKDRSEPDAIITSWWDFGHWFKAVADRAVTFDGGSQNNPMAHWVGKLLLTNNEEEAVGILRMLDCSSDLAGRYIQDNIMEGDIDETIKLINTLTIINRTTANNYLDMYNLNNKQKEELLDMMYCEPPESYLITSGDMVMKSGVWAHFGSWDFEKSQMWSNVKGKDFTKSIDYLMKNFSMTEKYAEEVYYEIQGLQNDRDANAWIAPWPSFMSQLSNCLQKNVTISCDNGLVINTLENTAKINTQQGLAKIKAISFIDSNGKFVSTKYDDSELDVGAVITPQGQSILVDPLLVDSMFVRLFYMNSIGLTHFEKFSDKTTVTGDKIIVWKTKWRG